MPLLDFDTVNRVAAQFGYNIPGSTFTADNINKLIHQESAGRNEPPNRGGYAGYFQMKPSEFGLTPRDFSRMSVEDQLKLYAGSYLPKYKYNGTQDLGVMNAAPAYANSPDEKIAYPAGSKEALANPQWVKYSNAGGAVTVGGIKAWAQAGNVPSPTDASGNPAASAALKVTIPASQFGPAVPNLPAFPFSPGAVAQQQQQGAQGTTGQAKLPTDLSALLAPPSSSGHPDLIKEIPTQFSLLRSLGIPTLF